MLSLTREDCFRACEDSADCSGVISLQGGCFPVSPEVESICRRTISSEVLCSKIKEEIFCSADEVSFEAAENLCESELATIPSTDELDIQKSRIIKECNTDVCWVYAEEASLRQCFSVSVDSESLVQQDCSATIGYCCERTTLSPSSSPTKSPTNSPTYFPTRFPTRKPTGAPTHFPTRSPTQFPTYSPVKPTSAPIIGDIGPSTSPTFSPSLGPSYSPTVSPTDVPTQSPSEQPVFEALCRSQPNSNVYTFNNSLEYPVQLAFLFVNKRAQLDEEDTLLPGLEGFYTPCYLEICFGFNDIMIPAFGNLSFRIPSERILYSLDGNLPLQEITGPELPTIPLCTCHPGDYLDDDFDYVEQETAVTQLHENWTTFAGTVTRFLQSDLCLQGSCLQFSGTISFITPEMLHPVVNTYSLEPKQPSRKCTFNIWTRENNSEFQNELYMAMLVFNYPLKEKFFASNFPRNSFLPYGITVEYRGSQRLEVKLETTTQSLGTELSSGLVFDNSSFICCCPGDLSDFPLRVVQFQQGTAGNFQSEFSAVQVAKSDTDTILSRGASYEPFFDSAITLGIQGSIVYEFDIGATEYVFIYEKSFFISCSTCEFGYSVPDNNEDATVEVSVDGVSFVLAAESLTSSWQLFEGGDDTIRFVNVSLPNGACYKYIRINDTSIPVNDADDGFDLHAIVAGEVCCWQSLPELEVLLQQPGRKVADKKRKIQLTLTAGVLFVLVSTLLSCLSRLFVFCQTESTERRERLISTKKK
eukprot:augustus_masked-scaffold_3-processed-gene-6.58-mRNA-1 protein AED:0.40 eAED:0.41 QI:0/-1/0/1/-1/1/1/0/756